MYFDIGLLAIVVLFALVGLARGFFKPFNGLLATLAAFVIIYFTLNLVTDWLFGLDKFKLFVDATLPPLMSKLAPKALVGADADAVPTILNSGFFKFLAEPIQKAMVQNPDLKAELALGTVLTYTTLNIVVALLMFAVIRLVLIIFTMILNSLSRDKAKNGINRLFGFLVGAVRGAVFACTVLIIATPFVGLIPADLMKSLNEESVVCKPVTSFLWEHTADFVNPEKILGVEEEDNDPSGGDDEALEAKRAEVAALVGEIGQQLQGFVVSDYQQPNALDSGNGLNSDVYAAFVAYINPAVNTSEFIVYINGVKNGTVEECDASIALLTNIKAALAGDIQTAFTALQTAVAGYGTTVTEQQLNAAFATFINAFATKLNQVDATLALSTDIADWDINPPGQTELDLIAKVSEVRTLMNSYKVDVSPFGVNATVSERFVLLKTFIGSGVDTYLNGLLAATDDTAREANIAKLTALQAAIDEDDGVQDKFDALAAAMALGDNQTHQVDNALTDFINAFEGLNNECATTGLNVPPFTASQNP